MADSLAKLFAEIGFNVNEDGFNKTKQLLEDLKKSMSEFQKVAKSAAEELGIFSNEKNKIDKEFQNEDEKSRRDNIASKKNEAREENKTFKERVNNLKIFYGNVSKIFKSLRALGKGLFYSLPKSLKLLADTAYQFMKPSLEKAYQFENFSFESGMKLGEFQKFQRMFLLSGIRLSPQDLMSDMINVQRNLTKVALNQGGVLDAYKLTDVREAAQRNDLNAVLTGIIRGVRENPQIDESMLVQLMDMFGFGHGTEWARMIRENPQDVQELADTFINESQRTSIKKAFDSITLTGGIFENLRDQITSQLAPALRNLFEGIQEFLSKTIKGMKEGNFDELFGMIREDFERFNEWVHSLKPEDWEETYKGLKTAMKKLYQSIKFFAGVLESAYKTFFTFIGTLFGFIFGGPLGAAVGASLGGAIDLARAAKRRYGNMSEKEKKELDYMNFNPDLDDIDAPDFDDKSKYIHKGTMNDVVKQASNKPAVSNNVEQTMNNYINTTLNGLTDKQQAEEFDKIIDKNIHDQKGFQVFTAKNNNLVYVSGKSVTSGR